ncbi:MAG: di-heme-cytochrome C peroxidase, partial [Pseudomonadota bacterium]
KLGQRTQTSCHQRTADEHSTCFPTAYQALQPSQTQDFPETSAWLGLTCAACHTADIEYEGSTIRVDGGPAMIDHESFLSGLASALRATHEDTEKFTRFAKRVLADNYNEGEAIALKARVGAYTGTLEQLVKRNKADHAYGFARLDAFGAILNQVLETALEIPENHAMSSAPASFPFLWDAPQLDWVQWNGSADNPLGRNVGEVMGVYAHLKLTGTPQTGQFTSTARIDNLFRLEDSLTQLQAPAWPEDILGTIDQAKAEQGKQLFASNCVGCHSVRDENGQFPMTPPNKFRKQFIRTKMISFKKVGTDPQMVLNFIQREAKPGALAPHLDLEQVPEKVPAANLLGVAIQGVIQKAFVGMQPRLDNQQMLWLTGFREPDRPEPTVEHLTSYKARPLNGIWATAPYLHNGSVPNLNQLLLPDAQRVASFTVGSREFDPINVGFDTGAFEGGFTFDTSLPGNLNTGHSGPLYTQAKGEDDAWRDFTETERLALVEYMKTLK